MPIQSVILFLIAIVTSALLLGLTFALKTRNNARYLNVYFYYVVAVVSYGFVNWVGPSFVAYVGELDSVSSISAIIIFTACAVPLALVKLYLFVEFLLVLLDQLLNKLLARAFFVFSSLATLFTIYLLSLDYGTSALGHTGGFLALFGILVLVGSFVSLFYFLSKIETLQDKAIQNLAKQFGWVYLLGYFVYASPYYLLYFIELPWYQTISPYLYYVMHLIPLFFLKQLSEQHKVVSGGVVDLDIDSVVKQWDISQREATILTLLLQGKNNNEIAEQLCISPNTVRNHIYNIYGKTGVKNRIQLKNLCQI